MKHRCTALLLAFCFFVTLFVSVPTTVSAETGNLTEGYDIGINEDSYPSVESGGGNVSTGSTDIEKEYNYVLSVDRLLMSDGKEMIQASGFIPEGSQIVFACYQGKQMSRVSIATHAWNEVYGILLTESYDTIKIMAFDNLGNCRPLIGAKVLHSYKTK